LTQKNNPQIEEVLVSAQQAEQRLDRVLTESLDGLSRSRLKGLIEAGHVQRNTDICRQPSQKVAVGDALVVTIPIAIDPVPIGQAMDLAILHEDADLIVIDKPAGLVVHPAPGNPDHTLVNALIAHCGEDLTGIGGVRRPGIVHRLDKDTSGVMVAAKTSEAHAALVTQFSDRTVNRAYRAIVWGQPIPRADEIEGPIGRHPRNRKKMAVVSRGGKHALTRYRSLTSYCDGLATLIECKLETGRTHQIRVHLAHRKHPIVGDLTYSRAGSRRALPKSLEPAETTILTEFPRQALHAFRLGFLHPTTGQHVDFETGFPPDIKNLKTFLESL
jgi:23S rRNA pseudouridine1911/1915/1917 synthase